jgi:hypothetical protein
VNALAIPAGGAQSVEEVIPAVEPQPLNPIARSRLEVRPVVRSPEQLRLHPALDELGWTGVIDELNDAARLKDQSVPEPILITTNGTILAGFGRWRSALFDDQHEINCIEYPLSEDEALQFIIRHHQPQRGWNAFIRIRLALKLETSFQKRALANMRAGGKYKGSANLPEAQHIDVRQEIARVAGVCDRQVSKVSSILQNEIDRSLARRGAINQPDAPILQVAPGRAVGAVHPLQRGTRNEQGDPSVYRSAQRGKDQRRRCHST